MREFDRVLTPCLIIVQTFSVAGTEYQKFLDSSVADEGTSHPESSVAKLHNRNARPLRSTP